MFWKTELKQIQQLNLVKTRKSGLDSSFLSDSQVVSASFWSVVCGLQKMNKCGSVDVAERLWTAKAEGRRERAVSVHFGGSVSKATLLRGIVVVVCATQGIAFDLFEFLCASALVPRKIINALINDLNGLLRPLHCRSAIIGALCDGGLLPPQLLTRHWERKAAGGTSNLAAGIHSHEKCLLIKNRLWVESSYSTSEFRLKF